MKVSKVSKAAAKALAVMVGGVLFGKLVVTFPTVGFWVCGLVAFMCFFVGLTGFFYEQAKGKELTK